MTLQQKFLLVVSMLGLTLLGSLGAVWWAFSMLQRELATPFSETAGVLESLREIKRSAEEQARIIYKQGVSTQNGSTFSIASRLQPDAHRSSSHLDDAGHVPIENDPLLAIERRDPGVRGPRGEPKEFAPSDTQIKEFRDLQSLALVGVEKIDRSDASMARIGISTWRNLKQRVARVGQLGEAWFHKQPGAQGAAGLVCYTIHELVEETEKQILKNAQTAVGYGDTIRWMLWGWLLSVISVGILGGALAFALLRRWVQTPVRALREAAARIAQGDLEHRVPVMQRDELGLLSAEVNHMVQMVRLMQDERIERERLAAIGEMVRRIVHNVRNPLSGIRGLAEVTRLDFQTGTPNRENMDLIVSTVDTFERWLTELLDATSPTSIHPREMEVEKWLSGIVEIHRSQAAARGVTLHLAASDAPPTAAFDPKHMDHAVSALVSNAIEATPEGGVVWVTARQPPEEGAWEVEVVDNGRGIAPDVLPRIFDAHFTTKRHGSGLGLAMAQQIVKGHTGRMSVRNGDNRHPERSGACFTIRLPIHTLTPPQDPNNSRSM